MEVYSAEKGLIADNIRKAEGFWARFRGLMLVSELKEGEGLFIKDCRMIHCFFMRFDIDVVYLDKDMRVVGLETVKPWRVGRSFRGARHVLELPAGGAGVLAVGNRLHFQEEQLF